MAGEKQQTRLRVHSSIDALPSESRESLEAMLADASNGLRYKDMADIIEEECGIRLSTSAISRYSKRYMRDFKRLDETMQQWRTVMDFSRRFPQVDGSIYISALIQGGLMRRILDGESDFDDMSMEDAIKLSIQAQRAMTYMHRYKDNCVVREEVDGEKMAAAHMDWLRGVLRDRPKLLEDIEASLTADREGAQSATSASDCVQSPSVPATRPQAVGRANTAGGRPC